MDAREFLLDFCRMTRDSKLRSIDSMGHSSPSSDTLDNLLDCLQVEADKWQECLKWLEAHGEA